MCPFLDEQFGDLEIAVIGVAATGLPDRTSASSRAFNAWAGFSRM
jgi:hypothetical protein